MIFSNCRGESAKKAIVSEYNLKPVVFIRLLNGQKIEGCCGPITDKYYLFEAEHKNTKDLESFCVGYDCGNQFLQLIGHLPLQLFNPFQAEPAGNNGGGTRSNVNQQPSMDPLNKELRNAIHILCSAWGGKVPKGALRGFLEYIHEKPTIQTNAFAIIAFNRIVGKDAKGRTLSQIIDSLRVDNPNLRQFNFPLMKQVLQAQNCASNL